MDLSISKASPSDTYHYAQAEFVGYSLENIICDKTIVLSGQKIFRRTKDFIDIYLIIIKENISKKDILSLIEQKNKLLENFDSFLNRKSNLQHSYELLKGVVNKPNFEEIYDVVHKYVEGYLSEKTNIIWDSSKLAWKEDE